MDKSSAKKILIVEDDEDLLQILSDKLGAQGLWVIKARNGREGLRTFFSEKPDLIILDILMPEMDGLTMMRELRKDECGNRIPVILLTNKTEDDQIIKELGYLRPSYYLKKENMDFNKIMEKIKDELKL